MQPLKGLTVVTLEHAIAAPFATRQLADLGARVIKIERPGTGDFARGYDSRVRGLASHFVFGTLDYALDLDLDIADVPEGLAHAASVLAMAWRIASLAAPVAGVTPQIDDRERLLADLAWSRRHGFGAKLCIHPRQVAPIHSALAPSAQAIDWAGRVLAAEATSPGAAQLDGRMIDRPVVLQAQRTLQRAGA